MSLVPTAACPTATSSPAAFTLETVSPAVTVNPGTTAPVTGSAANSCEVTITFAPFGQAPESATLFYLGATPIQLTASRYVTLTDYLGIPALFGAAVAVLLLLGCLFLVQVDGEKGVRRKKLGDRWSAPVRATGAWTLNDSWATNIATLVAIVATVLGVSSAASELFPGADIGKFVVVLDVIGAIAIAVPLGWWLTWTASALIGLFTVWYGVTAIRSLADPQPGSSMSGTAGTSFTL